jgi:hypothetical protein
MSKFAELKAQIDKTEAAAQARQDEAKAVQSQQARWEAERAQKVKMITDKILKPALEDMTRELGLKDVVVSTPQAKFTLQGTTTDGFNRRLYFDGVTIVELTFTRPPATGPFKSKVGVLFALSNSSYLWLFSGSERRMRHPGEPEPFTDSGVRYNTVENLEVSLDGEIAEDSFPGLRTRVDDALVENMKPLVAAG